MKEQYRWNYLIKVKTKEGTYEYEDDINNIDKILEQYPNYEEVKLEKAKVKKIGTMDKKPR